MQGTVEKMSRAESEAYFKVRPLKSRYGAVVEPSKQRVRAEGMVGGRMLMSEEEFGERGPACPRIGAGTASRRRTSSSGRDDEAACTTAFCTRETGQTASGNLTARAVVQ